jgi:hypothetical protein
MPDHRDRSKHVIRLPPRTARTPQEDIIAMFNFSMSNSLQDLTQWTHGGSLFFTDHLSPAPETSLKGYKVGATINIQILLPTSSGFTGLSH